MTDDRYDHVSETCIQLELLNGMGFTLLCAPIHKEFELLRL